ncbi:MAG: class II fructose-bisphosphate aldolase [Oscillospiraceae bacterium]|jgi:fructose-bisphosphate aldolase class II|nr:class II fructose-bisphosphate aldolase [Oscillospiraceae bacterium]
MLLTLKDILAPANERRYAVGMFNFLNLEMLRGITAAAEEARAPIILSLAQVHIPAIPFDWAAALMQKAAKDSSVPICLHLDHGTTKDVIFKAIQSGFTSVMYDGSALPYEENVENTLAVVIEAHKFGVSVEAELGHVGSAADEIDGGDKSMYTDPKQAIDFVEKTGVDALAVAIGSAHGQYIKTPKLDLERLTEIRCVCPVPLVLHGGSGLSDDDFHNCIKLGISKINICTDMCLAAVKAAQGAKPLEVLIPDAVEAVKQVVLQKIELFGSKI